MGACLFTRVGFLGLMELHFKFEVYKSILERSSLGSLAELTEANRRKVLAFALPLGWIVATERSGDPEFMNLPVLMVTALDDIESINRAFEAGATNFVTKPVNWTALAFQVKYVLRANQNAEELHKTKQLLSMALESAEVVHKKREMFSSADLEPIMADDS